MLSTQEICTRALTLSQTDEQFVSSAAFLPIYMYVSCAMLVYAILWQYYTGIYGYIDNMADWWLLCSMVLENEEIMNFS